MRLYFIIVYCTDRSLLERYKIPSLAIRDLTVDLRDYRLWKSTMLLDIFN